MTIKHLWTTMTTEIAEARAERVLLRQLREELATYRTEAEIMDLLAAISENDSHEADQVRGILERNLADMHRPLSLVA